MERSFGSKYGKWIALTAVVLALVLWFVLSGGVENYRQNTRVMTSRSRLATSGAAAPIRCICARMKALRTHLRTFPFRW